MSEDKELGPGEPPGMGGDEPAQMASADGGGQKSAWAGKLEAESARGRDDGDAVDDTRDLGVIMDIPVRLSMEVGNTQVSIGRLLKLSRGSVVELNRAAGEPLDVLVNGTLIAHGEVVMANEKFALRLTDVVSPSERLKNV